MNLSKTQHRIREDVDFCALEIDNGFITNQWQMFPWMFFPMNLVHILDLFLFAHQFSEMSNIFYKVRSLEFMMEFWLSAKLFPMTVAAFIVEAINIPQIIECSSPESATFGILFCLLLTWSFTLFTNSAASLPMTKISECASSWKLALSGCPDPSWLISPYLTDCAFPSRRVSPCWGRTCCTAFQEVLSGFPDRSCAVTSLFHSWEKQERS